MKNILSTLCILMFVVKAQASSKVSNQIENMLIGLYQNVIYMATWHPTENIKYHEQMAAHLIYSKKTLRSFEKTYEEILEIAQRDNSSIEKRQLISLKTLGEMMNTLVQNGLKQDLDYSMTSMNQLYSTMAREILNALKDFNVSDYSLNEIAAFESYIRILVRSIKNSSDFFRTVKSYPKIPILQILQPFEVEYSYLIPMANDIEFRLKRLILRRADTINDPELKAIVENLRSILRARENKKSKPNFTVNQIYSRNVNIERGFFTELTRVDLGENKCGKF